MKVDSGAEESIITEQLYKTLSPKPKLSQIQRHVTETICFSTVTRFRTIQSNNGRKWKDHRHHNISGKVRHILLSRYSAFDLSILHINVSDEPVP